MKYKVTLNGRTYEVEVEAGEAMVLDEYEALAPAAPAPAPAAAETAGAAPVQTAPAAAAPAASPSGSEPVNSPMPGKIISVKVSAGQSVKAGEVLVILEAMKMENEITAPRDGVVTAVAVEKGSTVETGSLLLSIA